MPHTRRDLFPMVAGAGLLTAAPAALRLRSASAQPAATPAGTPAVGTPMPAATAAANGTIAYALPGDGIFPEGVAFDAANNRFFAGSNATGRIFRGSLDDGTVEVFLDGAAQGLTQVNGLKIDQNGNLWACGYSTGLVAVYDSETGALIGQFSDGLPNNQTLLNDVAVTSAGTAYITDSMHPTVWVLAMPDATRLVPKTPISFEGTPFTYHDGINANGIVLSADEQHLIVVDSGTGTLYRVAVDGSAVEAIDTGGADLTAGDGLARDGDILYVCRNSAGKIARLRLSGDLTSAAFIDDVADPLFAYPTTVALTDHGTILVCNSQFNARQSGNPMLPFTILEVPLPPLADGGTPTAGTPEISATPVG